MHTSFVPAAHVGEERLPACASVWEHSVMASRATGDYLWVVPALLFQAGYKTAF